MLLTLYLAIDYSLATDSLIGLDLSDTIIQIYANHTYSLEKTIDICSLDTVFSLETLFMGIATAQLILDTEYTDNQIEVQFQNSFWDHCDSNLVEELKGTPSLKSGKLGIGSEESIELKMYPNPVQDILFVESGQVQINNWQVVSAMGKVCLNGTGSPRQINLEGLSKGVYSVKVYSPSGITEKSFVKL